MKNRSKLPRISVRDTTASVIAWDQQPLGVVYRDPRYATLRWKWIAFPDTLGDARTQEDAVRAVIAGGGDAE